MPTVNPYRPPGGSDHAPPAPPARSPGRTLGAACILLGACAIGGLFVGGGMLSIMSDGIRDLYADAQEALGQPLEPALQRERDMRRLMERGTAGGWP